MFCIQNSAISLFCLCMEPQCTLSPESSVVWVKAFPGIVMKPASPYGERLFFILCPARFRICRRMAGKTLYMFCGLYVLSFHDKNHPPGCLAVVKLMAIKTGGLDKMFAKPAVDKITAETALDKKHSRKTVFLKTVCEKLV